MPPTRPLYQSSKHKLVIDPDTYVPECPFTGSALVMTKIGDTGNWMARGEFYMTKPFPTKRALVTALATRDGKAPDKVLGEVVVTKDAGDNVPQSDPVADLVQREKELDDKLGEAGLLVT